jgi:transcriptional regulator with XRE-family HTH domain
MPSSAKPVWRVKFGERVRAARKALGWTQERLADVSGLHPTYIGDVERGERNVAALDNILKLAKALSVDPGHLLDGLQKSVPKR